MIKHENKMDTINDLKQIRAIIQLITGISMLVFSTFIFLILPGLPDNLVAVAPVFLLGIINLFVSCLYLLKKIDLIKRNSLFGIFASFVFSGILFVIGFLLTFIFFAFADSYTVAPIIILRRWSLIPFIFLGGYFFIVAFTIALFALRLLILFATKRQRSQDIF